ncbi:MAG TPA: LuxR C-terminal-related transcriptional regulator [Sphingomicrobium sp.]|nr:LuxR C-terminal-related transcriptional regulator [Sphingomicrobium sp.]
MAMDPEHERLIASIADAPIAMVLSNPRAPDNPLTVANAAFCDLTLYREDEILGRNCRFLAGERTDERVTDQLCAAIRDRRPVLTEILNYRRDGTAFRNGVMIAPIFGAEGELAWFLGSQVDLGPPEMGGLAERRAEARRKVDALPRRQREVLEGMARGLLNKQIAWTLKISEKTVKMHRALMIDRLGSRTSAEAIRIAVEAGL